MPYRVDVIQIHIWWHQQELTQSHAESISQNDSNKDGKTRMSSPTNGTAKKHILHSYLQYHDWILLNSMTLLPTDLGWKVNSEGSFSPVFSTEPVAPEELLKMTVCNCKKNCSTTRCSCRSMGIKCIVACGTCNGSNCSNSTKEDQNEIKWYCSINCNFKVILFIMHL